MTHQAETTVLKKTIRIVGVATDVTKASAPQTIGALWQKAGATGVITGQKPTYGVYFDYQDRTASNYRVLVGEESDAAPAPGQEVVEVPVGQYGVMRGEGAAGDIAAAAWGHIWSAWDKKDARQFQVDFERYVGPPENTKLELFVGYND